ncbi:hypothetical protein GF354_05740 [Candidatus Peregrinibacteria bacterium]|nr:hypothetical protein [Candidatus Peregrinibacteria bacterium]
MNFHENRLIWELNSPETHAERRKKHKEGANLNTLTAEEKKLKANSIDKVNKLFREKRLSEKQSKDLIRKLDHDTNMSPEIFRKINEEIDETVEKNELNRIAEEEKKKPLEWDDTALINLQKDYDAILEDHKDQLGKNQVEEYKKWFENERKNTPTIAHLEELTTKLKEKELPPRIEAYNFLEKTALKFGVKNIKDLPWTTQGLTEKTEYVRLAKEAELKIKQSVEKCLALPEQNKKAMQEVLKAKTPLEAQETLSKINKIVEKESENFTHLRAPIKIGKHSLKIMSKKEEKDFLKYYQERPFKERLVNLNLWPGFLKETRDLSEKLAKKLIKLYEDEPKNLKLALRTFEEQDFQEKEKSLKENEELLKEKTEDERKKTLLINACMTEVNSCQFIPQIDKKKFKDWYKDESNYKNPETGKDGDVKELEKCHQILISKTVDTEAGNIAAYKHFHKRHQLRIAELQELDPNVSESEINKWKNNYDQAGYNDRKDVHLKLKKRIKDLEKETKEDKEIEDKIEMTEEDKSNAEVLNANKTELKESIDKLSKQDKYGEAMIILMKYLIAHPDQNDDTDIVKYKNYLRGAIDLYGPGKTVEDSAEKEIDAAVDRKLKSKSMKKDLKEQQAKTLTLDGMKTDQKEDEHERAKKEALAKAGDDKIKKGIIEDFHEHEKDHIIDEHGYARKQEEIDFKGEEKMRDQDLERVRKTIYKDQGRLDKKQNIQGVVFKDKQGRELKKEEAQKAQEKELDKMHDEVANAALKDRGDTLPGENVSDLSARIAAKRAAKQKTDKVRHEKLKAA